MRIIMARPIRETPVLKGEDAFNFEMRRLEVEHMSKEQRAENRRKFEERVAEANKYINVCIWFHITNTPYAMPHRERLNNANEVKRMTDLLGHSNIFATLSLSLSLSY